MKGSVESYQYHNDFSGIVPLIDNDEQPYIYKEHKTITEILVCMGTSHNDQYFKIIVGLDINKGAVEHAM